MEDGARTLSSEEHAGYLFVIIVAAIAVVAGSLYLWRHISKPFQVVYSGPQFFVGAEKEDAARAAAQRSDQDDDGLSDYDEMEVFGTSPYIADSDSDGLSDAQEVQGGSDPNCAPGKPCVNGSVETARPDSGPGFALDQQQALQGEMERMQGLLEEFSKATPADVRTLMIESGIAEADVNAMSDDEVMTIFAQSFAQLTQQTMTGETSGAAL